MSKLFGIYFKGNPEKYLYIGITKAKSANARVKDLRIRAKTRPMKILKMSIVKEMKKNGPGNYGFTVLDTLDEDEEDDANIYLESLISQHDPPFQDVSKPKPETKKVDYDKERYEAKKQAFRTGCKRFDECPGTYPVNQWYFRASPNGGTQCECGLFRENFPHSAEHYKSPKHRAWEKARFERYGKHDGSPFSHFAPWYNNYGIGTGCYSKWDDPIIYLPNGAPFMHFLAYFEWEMKRLAEYHKTADWPGGEPTPEMKKQAIEVSRAFHRRHEGWGSKS